MAEALEPSSGQIRNWTLLEYKFTKSAFVWYSLGPISSILVNKYGSRPVMIAGGCLSGLGLIAASFCNSVQALYFCIGVVGGTYFFLWMFWLNKKHTSIIVKNKNLLIFSSLFTGLGLAFNLNPALTMIGKYFFVKRPIANGLAMAGSPVFLSTLAPLNTWFFDKFGWRGSFMILGGLLFNCCVAGSLMRPIGPKPTPAPKTTERKTISQTINSFIDLSLFKHRGFLFYIMGNIIMFFGLFAPLVFLSNYAKSKEIPKEKAAFLLSVLAFVDMVARPSMGIVANTKWVRPRVQYFFAASVLYNGVCHVFAPISVDYKGFVIYAIFFGFAFGWLSSVLFETLMDLVGAQRFSSAVGLVTIVECGPVLLGPPLLGGYISSNFFVSQMHNTDQHSIYNVILSLQEGSRTSIMITSTRTRAAESSSLSPVSSSLLEWELTIVFWIKRKKRKRGGPGWEAENKSPTETMLPNWQNLATPRTLSKIVPFHLKIVFKLWQINNIRWHLNRNESVHTIILSNCTRRKHNCIILLNIFTP